MVTTVVFQLRDAACCAPCVLGCPGLPFALETGSGVVPGKYSPRAVGVPLGNTARYSKRCLATAVNELTPTR
jgi:hypothetical protein